MGKKKNTITFHFTCDLVSLNFGNGVEGAFLTESCFLSSEDDSTGDLNCSSSIFSFLLFNSSSLFKTFSLSLKEARVQYDPLFSPNLEHENFKILLL